MTNNLITEQPNPIKKNSPAIWDLVIKDVKDSINGVEQNITDLIIQDMRDRRASCRERV